ncbi:MAG: prolipoprotein diacylglyceryl transferase [Bacteroidetes bacterium]|nr:prolipoprotein diacylglyceryl transferase [Bacteroidota bacterium]
MHPIIFSFGGITIYSFGLMMGISFLIGNYILTQEFKRKKLHPDLASNITLIALVAGVSGSKLLYLFENWGSFVKDPVGMTFSPGGLTFYGGFILATISVYIYAKNKNIAFIRIADAVGPALLLAYGIARIGCHLAGDGDYGFPTSLPWGTDYSNGTYPPSAAFRNFPEVTNLFPNGIVPDNTLCHPTPVYETIICSFFFLFLWKNRMKWKLDGQMFYTYLIFAGIERFSVEFFRLNPRLMLDLSEAQIIAVILILIGAIGLNSLKRLEHQQQA